MKDRVLRDFTDADIAKITHALHAWQQGENFEGRNIKDEKGFVFSAELKDIQSTIMY